jgi:hypothetical protein
MEIDSGERRPDLMHRSPNCERSEIDGDEAEPVDQLDDHPLGLLIVAEPAFWPALESASSPRCRWPMNSRISTSPTILDDFVKGVRDVSLVWPKRRFVPTRVRRVTDFFAHAIPRRL